MHELLISGVMTFPFFFEFFFQNSDLGQLTEYVEITE